MFLVEKLKLMLEALDVTLLAFAERPLRRTVLGPTALHKHHKRDELVNRSEKAKRGGRVGGREILLTILEGGAADAPCSDSVVAGGSIPDSCREDELSRSSCIAWSEVISTGFHAWSGGKTPELNLPYR